MVKFIYCNFENPDEYTYCIHCSKRLEFSNVDNFKFNHSITQEDNLSNNTLKQLYHKFLEEKYNTSNNNYFKNINSNSINQNKDYNERKVIAILFSSFICGMGCFYIKDIKKGCLFFFGEIFLFIFAFLLYALLKQQTIVLIMFTTCIILYLINILVTATEFDKRE